MLEFSEVVSPWVWEMLCKNRQSASIQDVVYFMFMIQTDNCKDLTVCLYDFYFAHLSERNRISLFILKFPLAHCLSSLY